MKLIKLGNESLQFEVNKKYDKSLNKLFFLFKDLFQLNRNNN